jgi:hypothetical protein
MVARSSLFCSIRSANFIMSMPRSVAGRRFHDGCLRALWAARTARSTSSAEAEWTAVISFSVLENHYLAMLECLHDWMTKYIRWVYGRKQITLLTWYKFVVDEKAGRLRPCSAIRCSQLSEELRHVCWKSRRDDGVCR